MLNRRSCLRYTAAAAAAIGLPAFSEEDSSTITIYVGATNSMDICARLVAEHLKRTLGRPVIVVPRLGAGQRLALAEAKRAAPDGRSFCFVTAAPLTIYPHIYANLDYDPDRDFKPIASVTAFDIAISTGPLTGATDMQQFVAWARTNPAKASFGSSPGSGSLAHFVGLALNNGCGLHMPHVPYKDSSVGMIDLAAGRLPCMITGLVSHVPMYKTGSAHMLAVSGKERSPLMPEVPTLEQAGINFSATTVAALFGPPRLPDPLSQQMQAALRSFYSDPKMIEMLQPIGMTMLPMTDRQLSAYIVEERQRIGALAKANGIERELG